jgi:hypothetical protein
MASKILLFHSPDGMKTCSTCTKDITNLHHYVGCNQCFKWYHLKCAPGANQKKISSLPSWTCSKECAVAFLKSKGERQHEQQDDTEPTLKDVYKLLVCHINEQKATMARMDGELNRLKVQVNVIKQKNLVNNIVISGLPNNITDTDDMFAKINHLVNGDAPTPAVFLEKVIKNQQNDKTRKSTAMYRAVFTNKDDKDNFMAAIKQHGPILGEEIFPSSSDGPSAPRRLAIRDELTPYYDKLFYESRRFAKENHFKYVWFKFQKIHIRKAENSRIFSFQNFESFEEFKNKASKIANNLNNN